MTDKTPVNDWGILISALTNAVERGANSERLLKAGTRQLEDIFELHVSRRHLARVTGSDPSYISRIFSGKQRPSLTKTRQLAKALGISTDDLCDYLGINGIHLRKYERGGLSGLRRRSSSRDAGQGEAGQSTGQGGDIAG